MATYGRFIEWSGGRAGVSDCDTLEEATEKVLEFAIGMGWTPPRWWQFWRWGESYWRWSKEDRLHARIVYAEKKRQPAP